MNQLFKDVLKHKSEGTLGAQDFKYDIGHSFGLSTTERKAKSYFTLLLHFPVFKASFPETHDAFETIFTQNLL